MPVTPPKPRLLFLITLLGAILGFHLIHSRQQAHEQTLLARKIAADKIFRHEHTENRLRDSFQNQFLTKALYLSMESTQAHLTLGPGFPSINTGDPLDPAPNSSPRDLTFTTPGQTISTFDNHSRTDFTVKQITPHSLILTYTATFDHRSFGKNLLTTDNGEFTLTPFQNPSD